MKKSMMLTVIGILAIMEPAMLVMAEPLVADPCKYVIEPFATTGLYGPHGLAMDKVGNLYVANEGYTRDGIPGTTISKITPDGQVSTFADGFEGPAGLAFDKNGNLWVSDDGHTYGDRVYNLWKITPDGTVLPGSNFIFGNPNTLAFDQRWNLFVVATGGDIWKINPSGVVSWFMGGFNCPQAIAFDKSGNVYTADADGTIYKIDPSGSQRVVFANIAGNQGSFAFDTAGNLYAPEGAFNVKVIAPNGWATLFVSGLGTPRGLVFDAMGRLYISDCSADTIWRVTPIASSERVVFKDDFNKGGLDNWIIAYGTWFVQNRKLVQTDQRQGGPWETRPTILHKSLTVSDDFAIETKYRLISGVSSSIIFKYQDPSNMLFVIFHQGTHIIIGKLEFSQDQGVGVEDNRWYPFGFNYNQELNVKIVVHGPHIVVYVDGILRASDSNFGTYYPSGKIGFNTASSSASYDDVSVKAITYG